MNTFQQVTMTIVVQWQYSLIDLGKAESHLIFLSHLIRLILLNINHRDELKQHSKFVQINTFKFIYIFGLTPLNDDLFIFLDLHL